MPKLPVYNMEGEKVGDYSIDPAEIAPRVSKQLLHDVVVMYQANSRQGSAKTRNRGEVSGSTKKMYRQKGTGNARAGSRRSGVRRGGGHINAKRPRDFSYRLPRKAIQAATRMAIATRIKSGRLVIIDDLALSDPSTNRMAKVLKNVGIDGVSVLVATELYSVNVYKSARNIRQVAVLPVSDLNALTVLAPRQVLVTKAALDAIKERAGKALQGKS